MANIELPKDAEGREIPLDTVALFSSDGNVLNIVRWIYTTDFDLKDDLANSWSAIDDIGAPINPELMYLTPPDSQEKLEEDLRRAIDTPKPDNFDSMSCGYFNNVGSSCQECRKKYGFGSLNCSNAAWKDILFRVRKLRSEG